MRQANYEQALKKLGVEYEYVESVPLADINVTRGKQMQARLEPLDHSLIDNYEGMLREGFTPPPLVLWKHGRSLLVPLDGNQRLAANEQVPAKQRLKSFSAYIVESDDPMVADRVCWTWNNMVNGRRLSHDDCLNHAVTFHRKYGQSIDKVSKEWGVKAWEVTARSMEMDIIDLMNKNGIKLKATMPASTLLELHPIWKVGEDVLVKALEVAVDSGFMQPDARALNRKVRDAKTHKEKLAAVDDFANSDTIKQRRAETKGGRVLITRPPRVKLQHALDGIDHLFTEFGDKKALQPVGEDRDEYREKSLRVANRLIEIYGLGAFVGQGGD